MVHQRVDVHRGIILAEKQTRHHQDACNRTCFVKLRLHQTDQLDHLLHCILDNAVAGLVGQDGPGFLQVGLASCNCTVQSFEALLCVVSLKDPIECLHSPLRCSLSHLRELGNKLHHLLHTGIVNLGQSFHQHSVELLLECLTRVLDVDQGIIFQGTTRNDSSTSLEHIPLRCKHGDVIRSGIQSFHFLLQFVHGCAQHRNWHPFWQKDFRQFPLRFRLCKNQLDAIAWGLHAQLLSKAAQELQRLFL